MKEIELTRGFKAIVDDDDFEKLSKFKWHVFVSKNTNYAQRKSPQYKGKRGTIRMHRVILGVSDGRIIDHINRNGLDNRKCNLRVVTASQNNMNKIKVRGESKFKGIHWNKKAQKWSARIVLNRRITALGNYNTEVEAAMVYNIIAKKVFGKHALLNKLNKLPSAEFEEKILLKYNNSVNRVFSSKYKGVYWDKNCQKWIVRVTIEGIRKTLYRGKSEEDAVKVLKNNAQLVRLRD